MAQQVYSETFFAHKELHYEDRGDIRAKAIKDINNFLLKNETLDIVNIIERWVSEGNYLYLTVYFKGYI